MTQGFYYVYLNPGPGYRKCSTHERIGRASTCLAPCPDSDMYTVVVAAQYLTCKWSPQSLVLVDRHPLTLALTPY